MDKFYLIAFVSLLVYWSIDRISGEY